MKNQPALSTPMLRNDLQQSLNRSQIDPSALSTFQRIY
jgi:hypothetical protein